MLALLPLPAAASTDQIDFPLFVLDRLAGDGVGGDSGSAAARSSRPSRV